ncbi:MAG: hypothetical protein IKA72_05380 [Clostridia bacterium]|nr:hypothetical protein [Clostridia bacterium]
MKTLGKRLIKRAGKVAVYDRFCAVDIQPHREGVLLATAARNCDFEKGALRSGFGAKAYYLESDDEKVIGPGSTMYGHPKIVFTTKMRTNDGLIKRTVGAQTGINRIFVYDIDGQVKRHLAMPQTLLKTLSYVYPDGTVKMIFCCTDQLFFYDFTNKVTNILSGSLTGACLFHERLFVADKNTLKYSKPMDVGNFEKSLNGGGEISFEDERGEIVWIESLGECIYVFFQYGIARLTADGEGSEFKLIDIPYNGERIIPRTVCVYENKLVFASHEGIFVLDGKKCSKIKQFKYLPIKDSTLTACAACVGNRYFLYYVDSTGKKRSVCVDLEDENNGGEYFILYGLNQSGGKALFSCDYVYSYLDRAGDLPKGEQYLFQVERCDFGSKEEKAVRYIALEGVGNCSVTVKGRSGTRTLSFELGQPVVISKNGGLNFNGSDAIGCERELVGLKGREFFFEFVLQKGCVIRKMTVEYDELGV